MDALLVLVALILIATVIGLWVWTIRDMWRRQLPWWQWPMWLLVLTIGNVFGFAIYFAVREGSTPEDPS